MSVRCVSSYSCVRHHVASVALQCIALRQALWLNWNLILAVPAVLRALGLLRSSRLQYQSYRHSHAGSLCECLNPHSGPRADRGVLPTAPSAQAPVWCSIFACLCLTYHPVHWDWSQLQGPASVFLSESQGLGELLQLRSGIIFELWGRGEANTLLAESWSLELVGHQLRLGHGFRVSICTELTGQAGLAAGYSAGSPGTSPQSHP